MNEKNPTRLPDDDLEKLKQSLQTRSINALHLGYLLAGSDTPTAQCVVADVKDEAVDKISVCGAKSMLIEELFILGSGEEEHVVDVQQGSVILLPAGQPHGIVSDDPDVPIRALLTFTPGLAPKDKPEFRDEKIIHLRTSDRLRELLEHRDRRL